MTKQPLTRDLAEVMESLRRTLEVKKEAATPETPQNAPKQSAAVIQLPLWPEPTRGTPNSFLRGALFAAIQGKTRQYLKRQILASQKGSTIRFTGMQLDQSDLDVWEQAAALAQPHPLGNVCHFHINAFLRDLGRNTGKSDHEWLKDAFARLMTAGVEITEGRYTYGGAMLEFRRDEVAGVYIVRLNPTILNLYKAGWTAIDWDIRRKLRRKPLALWLHGYYSSHAKPLPVQVDTLRSLSGSKDKTLFSYRQKLRRALDELKAIGAIASWQIEAADLVTVDRGNAITASQRRHLTRKPKK
jgi:TrfA protein